MKHSIFSLLWLIMTVSAEASHTESLRTFSAADSRQSFCSTRCEVLKEPILKAGSTAVHNLQSKAEQLIADIKAKISEENTTDFSLPIIYYFPNDISE